MGKTDFNSMTNAELNIKIMAYKNEYETKRQQIISAVERMKELDKLFLEANEELSKRGLLS